MSKALVFLHGWAQSRQIWFQQFEPFADALFLNLPGHGTASNQAAPPNSAAWLTHIHDQLPRQPCVLVGWSLGGMLALQLATQFPQSVAALALVSSTPCFRQRHDWPSGCDDSVFAAFEQAVSSQSPRLLNRFFSLMLQGDRLSRSDYNHLAKLAIDRAHPTTSLALQQGLELLASLDVRQQVQDLNIPSLLLHGQEDVIVSAESSHWLAANMPANQQQLFQGCGHAPFLTQPERFNTILKDWWTSL